MGHDSCSPQIRYAATAPHSVVSGLGVGPLHVMSSKSQIVAGGGYLVREFIGRPKFRLFCFIALLWLPVTFLFSLPLWSGEEFIEFGWLCWLFVIVEPILVALALFFRFTESPRNVVEHHVR